MSALVRARRICLRIFIHLVLCVFIVLMLLPLYLALIAASHGAGVMMQSSLTLWPGTNLLTNMQEIFHHPLTASGSSVGCMLFNSLCMALTIAVVKLVLAILSAFALLYFEFPLKKLCFVLIFSTMMLPVEVRIMPTFQVIAAFGWLNTFAGLTIPLTASATATFLFRQFFKTIPRDLVDAAKLDGASPLRFFIDILLPLSVSQITALFVIMFVYGWNQYLWPLVITSDVSMASIVMGIHYLSGVADQVPQWHYIMSMSLIALLPPCILVIVLQKFFEKGLVD